MYSADEGRKHFLNLHPDDVLNLAESSFGKDFSNLFRPLNSYINRVFELEERDGQGRIIKFYRPGRWRPEALLEEHRFLHDLHGHEIPVICPLTLADGSTLGTWKGINFALFPKCGGRSIDEFNDEQWVELGRLVGRTHGVGTIRESIHREIMHPLKSTARQIDYLKKHNLVIKELRERFFALTTELLARIEKLFEEIPIQRIHGDLHFSNIIYRPGESFYLIDFDDMVMGPQVQDIWMLLQNYTNDSLVELDLFLEGYETFHIFDRRHCKLIEPLRAMRYIHYLAWCGYQVVEDGRTLVVADYGSHQFWETEIGELEDQMVRIEEAKNPFELG